MVRLLLAAVLFLPAACVVAEVPLQDGTLRLYKSGGCEFSFKDLVPEGPNPYLEVHQGLKGGWMRLSERKGKDLPETIDLFIADEWVLTTDVRYESGQDCMELPGEDFGGAEMCWPETYRDRAYLRIPSWQLGNLLAQVDGPVEIEFRSNPSGKRKRSIERFRYRLPAGFGEALKTHLGVCNKWRALQPATE